MEQPKGDVAEGFIEIPPDEDLTELSQSGRSRRGLLRTVAAAGVAVMTVVHLHDDSRQQERAVQLGQEAAARQHEEEIAALEQRYQQAIEDARQNTRDLDSRAADMATDCMVALHDRSTFGLLTQIYKGELTVTTQYYGVQKISNPLVLASDIHGDSMNIRFGWCGTSGNNVPFVRVVRSGDVTLIPEVENDQNPYVDILLYGRHDPSIAPDGVREDRDALVAFGHLVDSSESIVREGFRVGILMAPGG
jgi:hypothetical protein